MGTVFFIGFLIFVVLGCLRALKINGALSMMDVLQAARRANTAN